jgi:hypothetical protein
MGKTFSTGLLTDGISQDSSNNIGIGGAPSGTNKFEVSGSTKLNGNTAITGSLSVTAGITGSFQGTATTASYVLNAVSASFATTASYAVSASVATNAVTASYVLNAVSASFATSAVTSSFANAFTVAGTLTATTLVVQTITSSVLYSSGSNIFGNSLSNTQVMTGSVGITGSLNVAGTGTFSSSVTASQMMSGGSNKFIKIGNTAGIFTNSTYFTDLVSLDATVLLSRFDGLYTGGIFTYESATADNVGIVSNGAIKMVVNGSPDRGMFISGSGNVGIGTISPTNLITLQKLGSISTTPGIDFRGTLSLGGAYNNLDYNSGRIYAVFDADSYTSARVTIAYPTGAGTFADGLSVKNGNVGIGTTSPSQQFSLGLGSSSTLRTYTTDGQAAMSFYTTTDTNLPRYLDIAAVATGNDGSLGGSNIRFLTQTTSSTPLAIERMRITSGGSVYIGATTASYPTVGYMFGVKATSGTQTYLSIAAPSQTLDSEGLVIGVDASSANIILRDNKYMTFFTNNTEKMRISSAGIITAPYQVSFKAYIYGSNPEVQKSNSITLPYNAEEYDNQGNFSTSTYTFTAPVAGKYLFTVNLNVFGLDDTAYLNFGLYINSSSTRWLYIFSNLPTGNTGDINLSGSDILNLTIGDTVKVRVYTDGSGPFGMSAGLAYNSFSGHLLG